MNGRELVILLLGLAIVAVVLRGLFVAINARRGQIKLAIDKNIPQNVDLESLELAELPGGGARVVTRSLEEVNRQNNALDLAETKAKSLNLADAENEGHIPVLMDAVELSEPGYARAIPPSERQQEVEEVEDLATEAVCVEDDEADGSAAEETNENSEDDDLMPRASQEHSIGENWDEDESESESEAESEDAQSELQAEQEQEHVAENVKNSDSLLFDYADEEELEEDELRSNVDTMNSIAPDYVEESEVTDDVGAFSAEFAESIESTESTDDDSYEEHDEYEDNNLDGDLAEQVQPSEQEPEEQPAPFNADSSADEFSMTAGERIGGNSASTVETSQSSLFDDIDDIDADEVEVVDKPKSRRSLFSLFGRKQKQKKEPLEDEQQFAPLAATVDEMEVAEINEPADVLLEEAQAQVNVEEIEHEESVYVEPAEDEELVDELDQQRAGSVEIDSEEQSAHAEEFEPSEVLVLNVTAKNGRVFAGDDLLQILITSGLKFGDMNIFHKRLSKEHHGTVIFSVANMLNPGTFDLNNMDEFTTLGISFFLALPTPINNLDAFEQMLGVAQEIRATLDGDLKDDHRNGMNGQTIEHYRQRVRDFELRRLKAVAARS
ncbi:MAG: cell division protein ZipA [Gammaproteobacteria bacterium]|nr:cell division protein ZipA [Gammaproteobacteria bacterium]